MARQKQVYNTSEVPHLWAHKTQDSARNPQGNLYFSGPTIYSYGSHFPIATFVQNSNGDEAILFTTRTYSNTTAKHIHEVRAAIPRNATVFDVPLTGRWGVFVNDSSLQFYRDYFIDQMRQQQESAKTARLKDRHYNVYARLFREANQFCIFFALEMIDDFWQPTKEETDKWEETARKHKDAQAERDRQRRVSVERALAEFQAEQAKSFEEKLAEWKAGTRQSIGYYYGEKPTYLRVNGDNVETSRGAVFPVRHAKRGLKLVEWCRETHHEYNPSIKGDEATFRLGHYKIDRVTEDGTVYAGCHVVEWPQIEEIKPQLEAVAEVVDSSEEVIA